MHVAAIIAAGGRGQRLGADRPKQLLLLGGRTILQRSVEAFVASSRIDEIVVAVTPEVAAEPPAYLRATTKPLVVVVGGERRQDSVGIGFDAIGDGADVVVVHDAARPFVSVDLIARTIDAAIESGVAIPALAARDTVKEVADADRSRQFVTRTLSRESIALVQTPQAFRLEILREAIRLGRAGLEVTDEASLAERAGHAVRVVEGDPRNIKITTPEDMVVARGLVAVTETQDVSGSIRVGTGYDIHRLVGGRTLVLGGVVIPFPFGLDGHSDADALCHAVTDAILGAAAAGDIGRLFPDTDDQWKGASSLDLLARAVDLVRSKGYRVGNVDAVVMAERPRLAPYVGEITARLAGTLGVPPDCVSVKGKTGEGLGEIGRGEAIAAHAVALLRSSD
jgi:2-C-methyl-D-erythritol 4-phosphate cytidylyltransferase / 2-C-methyl-D-erythritol 2,4-cyclodiphosphate synthase